MFISNALLKCCTRVCLSTASMSGYLHFYVCVGTYLYDVVITGILQEQIEVIAIIVFAACHVMRVSWTYRYA